MTELLKSKKFLAAILAVIIPIVNKLLELDLDEAEVYAAMAPLIAFIAGQSVADFGKERAKVEVNDSASGFKFKVKS